MSDLPLEFVRVDHTEAAQGDPWSSPRSWAMAGTVALAAWLGSIVLVDLRTPTMALGAATVMAFATGLVHHFRTQPTPVAVNANHPWVLDEPLGRADVMVCDVNGRWHVVGDTRCRVGRDPLLGEPQVVEDADPWGVVCRWPPASDRRLHRWMAVLNHALALRDAANGFDEEEEEARRRAAADTALLERSWPEPEEALEEGSALSRWLDAGRKDDGETTL